MGKLFGGIFYTFYWRNHVRFDRSDSMFNSLIAIIGLVSVNLMSVFFLLCIWFKPELFYFFMAACIIYFLIFTYLFHKKRYKHIIRRHSVYKNKKISTITTLYIILSMLTMFLCGGLMALNQCKILAIA